MSSLVVETVGLTRWFGRVQAVDHLGLAVPEGSVYGFLGPNGAGKSTTIRLLLGVLGPDEGLVELFGEPLRRNRLGLLRRVGSLVEEPSLYPHLTGAENMEVARRMVGATRAQVALALATVGLTEAAKRTVRGYSQGMRQRLGIALALLGEPDLLILDEPTNGLDPAGIMEMRDLIRALPETTGTTVLLSSHLLREVEQVATCIGIVNQGRLLFQGTKDELWAEAVDRLIVDVNDPARALRAMHDAGWAAMPRDETTLVVEGAGRADAGHINEMLLQRGLRVFALQRERVTLEDLFLRLTAAGERLGDTVKNPSRYEASHVSARPHALVGTGENGGSR